MPKKSKYPLEETILKYYKEVHDKNYTWTEFRKKVKEPVGVAMVYETAVEHFKKNKSK